MDNRTCFLARLFSTLEGRHFECKLNVPLPSNPFFQNFKTLKSLYGLVPHQVHPINVYFYTRGHVFVVQRVKSIV